ncbi:MAG: hypothetical protein MUO30_01010 [Anaerolineales bacterium]|nr:hypothetical protein [Anaerolineales bacterium]
MNDYDINIQVPRIGLRAQILATWYLRFNGFFIVPNFILHDAGLHKQVGGQLSEADLLAIRLPYTHEIIKGNDFKINIQPDRVLDLTGQVLDFVIVEVSSEQCKFNWLDTQKKNINQEFLTYALRRFGWWSDIEQISYILAKKKRLDQADEKIGLSTRIRLLSLGNSINRDLEGILQITFHDVLRYLKEDLFASYGLDERLKAIVSDHKQWDPLICQVYNKLIGHKVKEHNVEEVLVWLFPDANVMKAGG